MRMPLITIRMMTETERAKKSLRSRDNYTERAVLGGTLEEGSQEMRTRPGASVNSNVSILGH